MVHSTGYVCALGGIVDLPKLHGEIQGYMYMYVCMYMWLATKLAGYPGSAECVHKMNHVFFEACVYCMDHGVRHHSLGMTSFAYIHMSVGGDPCVCSVHIRTVYKCPCMHVLVQ